MVKIVEEKKTDNVRLVDANQNKSDDFIETKKSNQQVEEIAIGYGAEPPVLEESKSVVKQNAVKNIEKPSPSTNEKIENKSAAEPQDEFSLLKAKLDKSVYARSTKSNIKVSSSDSSAVFSTPTVDARQINSNTIVSSGTDKTKQDANAVYHTVVKGETGYSIAKKYGIKIQQLNEWNALDFGGIKIGQKLRVK
jgi:LysM repeat protein